MKNVARDRHGCRYRRAWSANEDRQETAAIGEQRVGVSSRCYDILRPTPCPARETAERIGVSR